MTIQIFFDSKNSIYYVRYERSCAVLLPEFREMNDRQQEDFLREIYTEDEAVGYIKKLEKNRKIFYESDIMNTIGKAIRVRNAESEKSARTDVSWKYCWQTELVPVSPLREKQLEEQLSVEKGSAGAELTEIGYDGVADDAAIVQAIVEHRQNKKKKYLVFFCDRCKRWQYAEIRFDQVRCQCGISYATKAEFSHPCFQYEGDRARFRASEKAFEQNEAQKEEEKADVIEARPYYYKGETVRNGKIYGLTLSDCEALHERLYLNCDVEKVFCLGESGTIAFNPEYEAYMKGLADRKIGGMQRIYKRKTGILAEIYGAGQDLKAMMSGFYRYFMENGLTKSKALCWREAGQVYRFPSSERFALSFCALPAEKRKALLPLYNSDTCTYFFDGYDDRRIELSRLIYEKCGGRFLYIDADDKIYDFGTDFIEKLHVEDGLSLVKNEFIQAIYDDFEFWDHVRGAYEDEEGYLSGEDENYYDKLCYYQFSIGGKRVLQYRGLSIRNSRDGIHDVKSIIRDCYLASDGLAQEKFSDLISLFFHTTLPETLRVLGEGTVRTSKGETAPFLPRLKELLNAEETKPSLSAYLFCLDTVSKSTKLWYGGRCDTLMGHAAFQSSAGKAGAFRELSASSEAAEILKYIYAERYESICTESGHAFSALTQALKEFQSQFDNQVQAMIRAEAVGRKAPADAEGAKAGDSRGVGSPKGRGEPDRSSETPKCGGHTASPESEGKPSAKKKSEEIADEWA